MNKKLIKDLKQRLKDLKKQESEFDSQEARDRIKTLGISRLIAEQDMQLILASNRGEQYAVKDILKKLKLSQKKI